VVHVYRKARIGKTKYMEVWTGYNTGQNKWKRGQKVMRSDRVKYVEAWTGGHDK